MKRRTILTGGATLALGSMMGGWPAMAQNAKPEKTNVTLGVGGKPLLYYLPLTIAEKKGFFEEQGLNVSINDFAGGSKSLQALVGGSVDVVTGAYEHTIRMQHKGQDIVGICNLGRFPGIVIAVRKDIAAEVKSVADLKGRTVGVTAPGSSTSLMLQYALLKNGLKDTDVSMIGVGGGAGAVAAIKQRQVEGLSHLDPVIAQLQYDGDIEVLLDTRTEAGTRELFGGPNPAATLYTTGAFIKDNPVTAQLVVNGLLAALKWLQTASADEVADTVPEDYLLGDRDLYKQAFENSREMFSPDGVVSKEGYESMMEVLKTLDPELADATVPYEKTFDARFVTAS